MGSFFSFSGRLNRQAYLLCYLALMVISIVLVVLLSLIIPSTDAVIFPSTEAVVVVGPDGQPITDATDLAGDPLAMPSETFSIGQGGLPVINWTSPYILLLGLVSLAMLIASLALGTRRLHDRNKSGWWQLLMLIPLVGFIWWVIDVCVLPGTKGTNSYGPDPLGNA